MLRVPLFPKSGIIPRHNRNSVRTEGEEEPKVDGVYVGKNLSFYGALLSFTSFMHKCSKSGDIDGEIPIVLEIELGEDCELAADEDVAFEVKKMPKDQQLDCLLSKSEFTWSEYESGVLVNQNIPVNWIKTIEYPILRDLKSISSNKKYFKTFEQDVWLLTLAYWQYKTNVTVAEFEETIIEFNKKNEFCGRFTNSIEFSNDEDTMILLHGFIKKSKKTPANDLKLAKQRLKSFGD